MERKTKDEKNLIKINKFNEYLRNNVERRFMDKLLSDIGGLIDKSREI